MGSPLQEEFKASFPMMADTITTHLREKELPPDVIERVNHCLRTTLQNSRLHHGLAAVYSARAMIGENITERQKCETNLLGWAVELFQDSVLIWDDIMDNSTTRRHQPCWYRRPEIGMLAVNDGALINSLIFWLLRKFFASHPSYFNMVELFHQANFTLQMGQLWDGLVVDMKRFSMDEYLSLLRYKACYYGVYLPITLGMEYCEISSDRNKSQVMDLAMDIGQYFQIQNDFLDVFGDTALTGKGGTDIQEKKFAWVICAALSRCNATQRRILETSYGKWDNNHVAHVKQVFQELDMHKVYQDFEETQSRKIQRKIEAIDESDGLKRHVISGVFSGTKKGREYRGIVRNMESSYAF